MFRGLSVCLLVTTGSCTQTVEPIRMQSLTSFTRRISVAGLAKLVEATAAVSELSRQLAVKERELAAATARADEVLVDVTASARAAETVKTQVQNVKDKAQTLVDDIAVRSLARALSRL